MTAQPQLEAKWRNAAGLSWIGLCAAYVIYAAATYPGLYQWLAELELRIFGSYDPAGTFIGLLIALWLPTKLIAPTAWKRPRPELLGIGVDPHAARRTTRRTMLTIGAVSLLTGVIATGVAISEGSDTASTALDLSQSTAAPTAKRLIVSGDLRTKYTYVVEETLNGNVTHTSYTPLTSLSWTAGTPVQYVLRETLPHAASEEDAPLSGRSGAVRTGPAAVFHHALPGMVRTGYERSGLRLAPDVIVLDENVRGANDTAWVVAIFGYLFAFVTMILWTMTMRGQQPSSTLPKSSAAYPGTVPAGMSAGPPRHWQLRLGGELMAELAFISYETPWISVSTKAYPGMTPFWRYFTDPQTWPNHDATFDATVQMVKQRGGFILIPEGGAPTQSFSLVNFSQHGGNLRR